MPGNKRAVASDAHRCKRQSHAGGGLSRLREHKAELPYASLDAHQPRAYWGHGARQHGLHAAHWDQPMR